MMRSAYITPTTSFTGKYGSFTHQANSNMNTNINMDEYSSNAYASGTTKYSQYGVNYENKYSKNPLITTVSNSDNLQFTTGSSVQLTLSKTLSGGFSTIYNDKSPIKSK